MKPHRHGHPAHHQFHHPSEGFNPDGPPHHHRRGPGRGGRGRAPRGDVRTAVLLLLAEEPMHGYQLMSAIAERSGGRWTPSPGAIYPAISQLEDEALVTVTAESGRKVVALTPAGRELVESQRETWADPFAGFDAARSGPDLRALLGQIADATRSIGRTGTPAQVQSAAEILTEARRSLYLLLADGPAPSAD